MKLAIMQPYFFPYIGYFQLINAVDKFVVYDDVNFIKRGWINRNYININNKKVLFTLPVKDKSQNKLINQHSYNFDDIWKNNFFKTLKMSYGKNDIFSEIIDLIKQIFNFHELNVAKFNANSLKIICNYLGIKTNLKFSSNIDYNRNLKGQNRILELCQQGNANIYINPIGGQNLYDKEKFTKNNIEFHFIKTLENIRYKQFNTQFIPNLSIIDVMMFNSPEKINKMLNEYLLI